MKELWNKFKAACVSGLGKAKDWVSEKIDNIKSAISNQWAEIMRTFGNSAWWKEKWSQIVQTLGDKEWWKKNLWKVLASLVLAIGMAVATPYLLPLLGLEAAAPTVVILVEGTVVGTLSWMLEATMNFLFHGELRVSPWNLLSTIVFASLGGAFLNFVSPSLGVGVLTNFGEELVQGVAEVSVGLALKNTLKTLGIAILKGLKNWCPKFIQILIENPYEPVQDVVPEIEEGKTLKQLLEANGEVLTQEALSEIEESAKTLKQLLEANDGVLTSLHQQLLSVDEMQVKATMLEAQENAELPIVQTYDAFLQANRPPLVIVEVTQSNMESDSGAGVFSPMNR